MNFTHTNVAFWPIQILRVTNSLYNPGFLQLITAIEANKLIKLKWNHRFEDAYAVQEISTGARIERQWRKQQAQQQE
jgi:hypothetical protein